MATIKINSNYAQKKSPTKKLRILNIPLYVEKIIEDNLPSVEEALSDLKTAWAESQKAEKKFKTILKEFI